MDNLKDVKKVVDKVKSIIEKIPLLCKNCGKGTLSGEGDTLECSFCKHPKK